MTPNIERLLSQAELLRNPSHQPVGAKWVLEAIADATREIERVAPDDIAADCAREIRGELAHLSTYSEVPTVTLFSSAVGERIAQLATRLR